uniref:Reverse transcriptase zinc-binding domain-containing protein n=1 Tax=Brassica oleracea TaxID=3712 RepID=A0A3P6F8B1_BRAOL|nr:unnamed protein product [Brassica oleracea]
MTSIPSVEEITQVMHKLNPNKAQGQIDLHLGSIRLLEDHHTTRVSWNEVTKPKKEGGLEINDLLLWNKACCLKLIWLMFFQAGSVWVAWFKEEVLNGDLSNLWTTAPNRRFSWQVNKLLKLSPLIYKWIHPKVSIGLSCRFWTDNWSPFGSLRAFLQLGAYSSMEIPPTATLASLSSNNSWRLPPARSETQLLFLGFNRRSTRGILTLLCWQGCIYWTWT